LAGLVQGGAAAQEGGRVHRARRLTRLGGSCQRRVPTFGEGLCGRPVRCVAPEIFDNTGDRL
jgi:hypothetical protein